MGAHTASLNPLAPWGTYRRRSGVEDWALIGRGLNSNRLIWRRAFGRRRQHTERDFRYHLFPRWSAVNLHGSFFSEPRIISSTPGFAPHPKQRLFLTRRTRRRCAPRVTTEAACHIRVIFNPFCRSATRINATHRSEPEASRYATFRRGLAHERSLGRSDSRACIECHTPQ